MRPTGEAVDEVIGRISNAARRDDAKALCELMRSVSGEEPAIWASRIVGFGTGHYRYESGREGDAPLIAFAAQASRLTIYLVGDFQERHATQLRELGTYTAGKSCLYVKRLADVDLDVLRTLLDRTVRVSRGVDRGSRGT